MLRLRNIKFNESSQTIIKNEPMKNLMIIHKGFLTIIINVLKFAQSAALKRKFVTLMQ